MAGTSLRSACMFPSPQLGVALGYLVKESYVTCVELLYFPLFMILFRTRSVSRDTEGEGCIRNLGAHPCYQYQACALPPKLPSSPAEQFYRLFCETSLAAPGL